MIRKIYQSDPLPWLILAALLLLTISIGSWSMLLNCQSSNSISFVSPLFDMSNGIKLVLSLGLITATLLTHRAMTNNSGILDFKERSSLYPLGLCLVTSFMYCHSVSLLLMALIMVLVFKRVMSIAESGSIRSASFDVGLMIAIGSLIHPLFVIFALFIWVGIGSLRTLDWNSIVLSFVGFSIPFIFIYGITFLLDGNIGALEGLFLGPLIDMPEGAVNESLDMVELGYIILVIILFIVMSRRSIKTLMTGGTKRRKYMRSGLIMLVVSVLFTAGLIRFSGMGTGMVLIGLPLSILFLEFHREARSKIDMVLFIVWVALSFALLWK